MVYLEKYFWLLPEKATSGHLEKIIPTSMKALWIMDTFFQPRDLHKHTWWRVPLGHATHWFWFSFAWFVPSSVGRSWQKGIRTVDWSPPGGTRGVLKDLLREWNGLSNFSIKLSKYSRTSLYEHHQNTLYPPFNKTLVFLGKNSWGFLKFPRRCQGQTLKSTLVCKSRLEKPTVST